MKEVTTQPSANENRAATVSGKVPESVKRRLEEMAIAEKRTVSFYVHEFVVNALRELDREKAA